MQQMRNLGIQTSVHYPPVHLFHYYRDQQPGLHIPRTQAVAEREVTLPLYSSQTEEQAERVIRGVRTSLMQVSLCA